MALKTMNSLTRSLLLSTVFISSIFCTVNSAIAARIIINGSDQVGCPLANCGNNGNGGVDFQTDNKLIVAAGQNVGQTGGVSVIASGGNNIGEIVFNGIPASVILGSVTPTGNILRLITLQNFADVLANGDVRVTTLDLPNGRFNLADGRNLTANVTGSTSSVISFLGTHTVTGDITGPDVFLSASAPGKVVTTTGNITSNNIIYFFDEELRIAPGKNIVGVVSSSVNNIGTLTFEGSSISGGAIGVPGFNLKQVNMNAGIFTLNHNIGALNTVVSSCAKLLVTSNVSITPNLINNGIVQIGTPSGVNTLSVGTYTGNPGSSLNLMVLNGGANYSRLTATGAVVIPFNGLKLIITGNTIPNNTLLNNIITTPALTLAAGTPVGTATYQFVPTYINPNLDITVLTTPMSALVPNCSVISSVARFFDLIGPNIQTIAPNLVPVYDALNAQPNAAALTDALASLTLPVNGNLLAVSYGGATRGFSVIAERMDNNRAEFARGETRYKCAQFYPYCCVEPLGYSMRSGQWIEFYTSSLDQASDEILTGSGYTALQWGLIAGYDKAFYPSLNAGAAVAYSQTNTTSKGVFNNTLSADSFQGFLYATHELCNGLYWDGILGLAYNDYEQERVIDLASHINPFPNSCGIPSIPFGLAENAKARFGGWQFNSYIEGGYQYRACRFVIVPHVIFKSVYLRTDQFSETGAPMAGFKNVQYDDMQEVGLGLGLKVAKNYICCKKYKFTPYIKLVALHDVVSTEQKGVSQFIGGGPSLTTTGDGLGVNSFTTTLGLTLNRKDNSFLTLEYDFEKRDSFAMYSAFLKYRVEWC